MNEVARLEKKSAQLRTCIESTSKKIEEHKSEIRHLEQVQRSWQAALDENECKLGYAEREFEAAK